MSLSIMNSEGAIAWRVRERERDNNENETNGGVLNIIPHGFELLTFDSIINTDGLIVILFNFCGIIIAETMGVYCFYRITM